MTVILPWASYCNHCRVPAGTKPSLAREVRKSNPKTDAAWAAAVAEAGPPPPPRFLAPPWELLLPPL